MMHKEEEKKIFGGGEASRGNGDEPYEYYISDTIKDIFEIVKDTPNNMELGKKIRRYYWNWLENNEIQKWE